MKTITKLMLAGSVLTAGSAAVAGPINVLPTAPGGSDLILFVTDTTNNASFVQDLGNNLDSLGVTTASVAADAAAHNQYSFFGSPSPPGGATGPLPGPIKVGAGILNGAGVDTSLLTFLNAQPAGGSYTYTIMAAATGNGTAQNGQQRYLAGYTATNGGNLFNSDPSSATAANTAQGANTWFVNNINAASPPPNSQYAAASGAGFQALGSFALATNNGSALGTAQTLYEVSTFVDGAQTDANVYAMSTSFTVNSDGTISGVTTGGGSVPLPAGVWLLGSGLLGLLGIGRRRVTA
jgi:hypothetical protein